MYTRDGSIQPILQLEVSADTDINLLYVLLSFIKPQAAVVEAKVLDFFSNFFQFTILNFSPRSERYRSRVSDRAITNAYVLTDLNFVWKNRIWI